MKEAAAVRPSASSRARLEKRPSVAASQPVLDHLEHGTLSRVEGVLLSEFRDIVRGDPITLAWPAVLSA
jgi:hypothetical protein